MWIHTSLVIWGLNWKNKWLISRSQLIIEINEEQCVENEENSKLRMQHTLKKDAKHSNSLPAKSYGTENIHSFIIVITLIEFQSKSPSPIPEQQSQWPSLNFSDRCLAHLVAYLVERGSQFCRTFDAENAEPNKNSVFSEFFSTQI